MRRHAPLHLLLAVLLLLAQQLAAAHGLSHLDTGKAPDHACELCVASAHLGAGLPGTVPALQPSSCAIERVPLDASFHPRKPALPFRSRAPPPAL
jgi:hypothetical protein